MGLWIMSGHGFAGLCGPRFRWEEEDYAEAEKSMPTYVFSDNASDHMDTPLPWTWRENTIYRVLDAWEFCLTNKMPLRSGSGVEKKDEGGSAPRAERGGFEGIEKVIAAVGLGGGQTPARRGVLSDELFATPEPQEKDDIDVTARPRDLADIIPPPPAAQGAREKKSTMAPGASPYPFATYPAQVSSSEEVVPFPPSPRHDTHETETGEGDDEEEEDDEDEEEEEGEEEYAEGGESENPSSGRRTSGSMSSLGRPVQSRYPFQFRRPHHQRGGSVSSASQMGHAQLSTPLSHQTHSSQPSRSSRTSHFTQSTGNRETSSDSPFSVGDSSNGGQSPLSSFSGSGIPMPPRHPQTRRSRAGTVPASVPSSPSPVAFPPGRPRARTRTQSVATETSMTFGPIPVPEFQSPSDDDDDDYQINEESLMDVPEAEGSIEEAEQHDSVGLLSASAQTSPRGSLVNLRHLGSNLSLHGRRANGSRSRSATSRSHSNSRSRTNSGTSISESARSRAQSLIQSLSAAASRSSVELANIRSRANSMARLSDSPYYSPSPDPAPSSPENHTFGHPLRDQWRSRENVVEEAQNETDAESREGPHVVLEPAAVPLPASPPGSGPTSEPQTRLPSPEVPFAGPSSPTDTITVMVTRPGATSPTPATPIPIPGRSFSPQQVVHRAESQPDISTAPQSFVTAPATLEGRTESSGQTPSSWGGMEHIAEGYTWKQV